MLILEIDPPYLVTLRAVQSLPFPAYQPPVLSLTPLRLSLEGAYFDVKR